MIFPKALDRSFSIVDRALRQAFPEDYYRRCMYAAFGIQALLKELGFDASILGGDMLAFAVARSGREASLQGFGNSSDGYAHYWVTAEGRLIDLGPHYLPLDSRYPTEPMPLVAWPLEEGLPVFLRYRVGEDFGPKTALAADSVIEQRMEDFLHLCRRKLAGQIGQPTLPHWVLQGASSLLFHSNRGDPWALAATRFSKMPGTTTSLPF